ncbi:MAG: transposase family protein [Kluyvera sp.]|uniref:transposase family protein n=1 Tax=Kluyvera sp. TaxID=1538228 RepID=UPI003A899350
MKNPAFGGSHYFNYKKFFSLVLLAVVDADYKVIFVDVGAVGSESDGGIFAQSQLANMLENKRANLPPADKLPGDPEGQPVDYFFVEDDAFALRSWMMKPYPRRNLSKPERIYNYRLCRARRVVENAYGILADR